MCDMKLVKSQDFFRLGMRQRLGERNGNNVQAVRGHRRDCRHQGNCSVQESVRVLENATAEMTNVCSKFGMTLLGL